MLFISSSHVVLVQEHPAVATGKKAENVQQAGEEEQPTPAAPGHVETSEETKRKTAQGGAHPPASKKSKMGP